MEDKQRPAATPHSHPMQIEVGEKEAEGIYSNLCLISHSSSEVILDFARALPGVTKSRVYARIIMTPVHAKSLLMALGQNLAKYEDQHGAIAMPGGDGRGDKDKKGIGF